MRPTLSLIKREFTAYFLSPIAYVVLALFLLVTGHLFYLTLNLLTASGPRGIEFPMQMILGDEKFWLVFLFIPPLLTMRLLAEERGTGTLEMLMTAPIRDWQVVLSKFIACFLFYLVLWLPTLLYLPVLTDFRNVAFPWRFEFQWLAGKLELILVLAAPVAALILALLPFKAAPRFVLQFLAVGGTLGVYLFLVEGNALAFLFEHREKMSVLLLKGGIVAGGLLLLIGLPFAIARGLFGGSNDDGLALSGWTIFLGFLAAAIGVSLAQARIVFQPISLTTGIDPRPIMISYLGAILAGAMFLAMGLFISSLVRSQMVAALLSLLLCLPFIVAGFWRPEMDPSQLTYRVLFYVSVPLHFTRDFTRGILDIGHVVMYLSTTFLFLFLTVRSLEARRWQ